MRFLVLSVPPVELDNKGSIRGLDREWCRLFNGTVEDDSWFLDALGVQGFRPLEQRFKEQLLHPREREQRTYPVRFCRRCQRAIVQESKSETRLQDGKPKRLLVVERDLGSEIRLHSRNGEMNRRWYRLPFRDPESDDSSSVAKELGLGLTGRSQVAAEWLLLRAFVDLRFYAPSPEDARPEPAFEVVDQAGDSGSCDHAGFSWGWVDPIVTVWSIDQAVAEGRRWRALAKSGRWRLIPIPIRALEARATLLECWPSATPAAPESGTGLPKRGIGQSRSLIEALFWGTRPSAGGEIPSWLAFLCLDSLGGSFLASGFGESGEARWQWLPPAEGRSLHLLADFCCQIWGGEKASAADAALPEAARPSQSPPKEAWFDTHMVPDEQLAHELVGDIVALLRQHKATARLPTFQALAALIEAVGPKGRWPRTSVWDEWRRFQRGRVHLSAVGDEQGSWWVGLDHTGLLEAFSARFLVPTSPVGVQIPTFGVLDDEAVGKACFDPFHSRLFGPRKALVDLTDRLAGAEEPGSAEDVALGFEPDGRWWREWGDLVFKSRRDIAVEIRRRFTTGSHGSLLGGEDLLGGSKIVCRPRREMTF
ncbi:MAG: hypothetical protein K0U98_05985 [Deltaproteobacteria bacterium]|nr:hypothetical protein [Deltaproteobacteria bacterium]